MKKLLVITSACFFLFQGLNAQNHKWEIDKAEERAEVKKQGLDSALVHLKGRWEIGLSYGRWFFSPGVKSNIEAPVAFDENMGLWEVAGVWHFSERLFATLALGIQLQRDIPFRPNIGSVLSGEDFILEGSGGIFIPVDVGVNYYFTKSRFRPFIGIGIGTVPVNFRYILAEGNIVDGITRTENTFSDNARLGKIRAGFDYRLGQRINFKLNSSYTSSQKFQETIGSYLNYRGFSINAGFFIVL